MSKLVINQEVLSQHMDSEAILLDMKSEKYFRLNSVAGRAWKLLERGQSIEAMTGQLAEEFDVTPEVLSRDLEALFSMLQEHGLLIEEQ